MGTVVSFDVYTPGAVTSREMHAGLARARAWLQRADAVFSLWKPESPMSRLRRGELALADAPPEIGAVLELCRLARQLTRGWFDAEAMPGGVDPTGLVKGWSAGRALDVLVEAGFADASVNAGGDVAVSGSPGGDGPWRIGIQHPRDRQALVAVVEVEAAIATSGTYERGPHLVDPFTGRSRAMASSATVTGPDLALADAMATALAVAGADGLAFVDAAAGYEALVVQPDGALLATPGLRLAALPSG